MEFNDYHHYYIYYCFDAYEKSGDIRFNGYFCKVNRPLLYALSFLCKCDESFFYKSIIKFLFSVAIITCALLIIPLVIYLMIADFKKSLHGRLCIALLLLQIFMVIFYPMVDVGTYFHTTFGVVLFVIFGIFAYSSNVCVTIMIFDIFISLRFIFKD